MHDGERVSISGSTGTTYELTRNGNTYACTCPAWTKQKLPADRRTCKHLRAHLGDAHEDARAAADPRADARVAAAQARARKSLITADPDPPALRAHRKAGLAAALDSFPAAARRMRDTYGMPLPHHIAHAAGFWNGLAPEERAEAWSYLGCGPAGISEWFADGGLDRVPRLDERLDFRFRCDPPEFVTVWSGNSDGGHFGLWYDDPNELPRLIAHNWARDSAENGPRLPTLLASLRDDIDRHDFPIDEYPHARAILRWLDEVLAHELTAHRDEKIPPPPLRTNYTIGGLDPILRGARIPADYVGMNASAHRIDTFKNDPTTTRSWISRALAELAAGEPMRALFLARDLHWLDNDAYREAAADLGIRAYQAVGRHALAEVLRVHVAHRDLPSVGIYGPPPVHPLVEAVQQADVQRISDLLAEDPPTRALTDALIAATDLDILERLLARTTPAAAADKLAITISDLAEHERHEQDTTPIVAVLEHLLARGVDPGPAFARALADKHQQLALRLAALVDLTHPDSEGMLPLHRATQAGNVAVVQHLLARGADRFARDTHGKTPHERARDIWQTRRAESLELLALLPAPTITTTVTTTTDHAVGDSVTHTKFGAGVIVARDGTGETAKLTIDFSDTPRQLLARFIRRA